MRLYCCCVVVNVGHLLLMMRSGEEIDHIESNRRLLGRFNYPAGTGDDGEEDHHHDRQ